MYLLRTNVTKFPSYCLIYLFIKLMGVLLHSSMSWNGWYSHVLYSVQTSSKTVMMSCFPSPYPSHSQNEKPYMYIKTWIGWELNAKFWAFQEGEWTHAPSFTRFPTHAVQCYLNSLNLLVLLRTTVVEPLKQVHWISWLNTK